MSDTDDTKSGAVPVTEGTPRGSSDADVDSAATNNGKTPPGSRRIAWTFLLVIVVVVFAAGFLSAGLLAPRLASILPWTATADVTPVSAQADKIASIEAAVGGVEQAVAALKAQVAGQLSELATEQARAVAELRAGSADAKSVQEELDRAHTKLRDQVAGVGQRVADLEPAMAATDAAVARMAAIERRLEELAQAGNAEAVAADLLARLERLESQLGNLAGSNPDGDGDDLAQRLAQRLAERVDRLEQQIESMPPVAASEQAAARVDRLETMLAGLGGRIDALNSGERSQLERGVGLVLAAAALRDATGRYAAYAGELAVVRELAAGVAALNEAPVVAALAELDGSSRTGVPTVAVLAEQFDGFAGAIVRAANRDDDAGWVAQTIDRVSSVVTVRRVGDVDGATVEARVARAELRLAAGDLTAAVAELAEMTGAAADAAAPWLDKAAARLAVDRTAQTVYQAAAHALLAGVPSE